MPNLERVDEIDFSIAPDEDLSKLENVGDCALHAVHIAIYTEHYSRSDDEREKYMRLHRRIIDRRIKPLPKKDRELYDQLYAEYFISVSA